MQSRHTGLRVGGRALVDVREEGAVFAGQGAKEQCDALRECGSRGGEWLRSTRKGNAARVGVRVRHCPGSPRGAR